MKFEMGGNFPLTVDKLSLNKNSVSKIFGIENFKNNSFYFSGRNAINTFLDKVYNGKKSVLLPIFTCDTCIRPFFEHGFEITYYNVLETLEVDILDFQKKHENFNGGIVYIQSYFGYNTTKSINDYLIGNRKDKCTYFQDLTHSWLSSFSIFDADYYITSFRKWLEIPDGAVLSTNKELIVNETLSENLDEVQDYVLASLLKNKYLLEKDDVTKDFFYPFLKKTASSFSEKKIYKMSSIAENILTNTDYIGIIEKRRQNALYLLHNIKNDFVTTIFTDLSLHETPLYFPVYIKQNKRDKFQKHLAEKNIYCPIHWPVSNLLETNSIYSNILSLVCDQRYSIDDMKYFVEVINSFIG